METIDPLLVLAGSFYLACKVEECPNHIKSVVNEMRHLFGQEFPYDAQGVAEFEFYLMEDLDFYTIVYHPYRPLQNFVSHLNLDKSILQTASFVLNDTYRTDLCLLYPPHIIALTALYITNSLHRPDIKDDAILKFLKELVNFDMVVVVECAQTLFNLYAVWKTYSETDIPAISALLTLL